MKRLAICLAACLTICSGAATASAQHYHKLRIQVAVGPTVPIKPEGFKEYWYLGPSFGTGLSYAIAPFLEAQLLLDAYTHTMNDQKLLHDSDPGFDGLAIAGGRVTLTSASINLKGNLPFRNERLSSYVLGGIGISHFHLDGQALAIGGYSIPLFFPLSDDALMGQFGFGIDIRSTLGFDFFGEGRVVVADTEGPTTVIVPLRFGIRSK